MVGRNIAHYKIVEKFGYPQDHPRYQQMLTDARDAAHKAGKLFGTASAAYRLSKDVRFTQNGLPNDGWKAPPQRGGGD